MKNVDSIVLNNYSLPQQAVDSLYTHLKQIVGDKSLIPSNVVPIVVSLMQIVEGYKDMSGLQKRQMVSKVLTQLIDDTMDNNQEAQIMKVLVSTTVPSLIDTLVAVDKKEIVIKTKKCLAKLFACCK